VFRGRGSLYAQPVRLVTLAAGLAAGAVVARGGAAGTGGLLVPSLPVGDPGLVPAASLATAVLVGTIVAPQLWPRLQAARDPASSRQAAMVAGALVAGLTVAAVAAGAADGQGEASAPTLAGQVASGLLAGGIVSGCLASGSALLLASTGAGQRLGARPVPTWIATASAAAGLAVAWHDIGLLTVLGWGFSFTAASLAPVVAAGCWWRSASSRGARWGASTGAALTAGAIAAAWVGLIPAGPPSLTVPALVCLPVALAVTGLVSLGSVDDRASHRPAAGLNPT
jgi:Na+/proline symporter